MAPFFCVFVAGGRGWEGQRTEGSDILIMFCFVLVLSTAVCERTQVPFDRDAEGRLALCLEASHNRARIIHWRDETGKAITTTVQAAALEHPNIRLLTGTTAVDLALTAAGSGRVGSSDQCVGAHVLVQVLYTVCCVLCCGVLCCTV